MNSGLSSSFASSLQSPNAPVSNVLPFDQGRFVSKVASNNGGLVDKVSRRRVSLADLGQVRASTASPGDKVAEAQAAAASAGIQLTPDQLGQIGGAIGGGIGTIIDAVTGQPTPAPVPVVEPKKDNTMLILGAVAVVVVVVVLMKKKG